MKRSKHNLSFTKLLSCDMGELVPIGLTEVLPGDTVQQSTNALIRLSPLLAPVMHPVHVRIHHWFVPYRLLWDKWEDFITGGPDGNDVSVFPYMVTPPTTGIAVGSLGDYLGIPTGVPDLQVSALPFRAYNFIFNEWYRDQDLTPEMTWSKDSGFDTFTNGYMQNCSWEKDYFTSARPWEQKGPAVTVPIGTTAPVRGTGLFAPGRDMFVHNSSDGALVLNAPLEANASGVLKTGADTPTVLYPAPGVLETDLSGASAVTVNNLRKALAIQRYEEARARYGSRYTEYLRYLGVKSSDARLQRPEYLGGGKQTVQFSEVLGTYENLDVDQPLGKLGGHGIGAMRSNRYRRFFEEHGIVMSLMSIRPKTIYTQGLPKHWNRRLKEDFWQKELEHIGQQEIKNKEIYAAHTTPDGTFGYQDRYDEYRRNESSVSGEFRETSLDYWHMARTFATTPALNNDFVRCVPTERIFAAPSTDVVYVMANHSIQARRLVAQTGSSFIY